MSEEKNKKGGMFKTVLGWGASQVGKAWDWGANKVSYLANKFNKDSEMAFLSKSMEFTLFKGADNALPIRGNKDKGSKTIAFWGAPEIKSGNYLVDGNNYIYLLKEPEIKSVEYLHKDAPKHFPITIVDYELEDKSHAPAVVNNYITDNSISISDSLIEGDINQVISINIETKINELDALIKNSEVSEQLSGLIDELKNLIATNQPVSPGKFARFAKHLSNQMLNVLGQVIAGFITKSI